ncbi:unnamed protein product [Rotaria sp. Silwood1]|nr:unnamed protein product [Rotaria sp. Silwood1]CAF3381427.1 unnamed protein product [Rotaria sp. Silwood1]CAF3414263.1 unnamed protein product [Rotaria sp. Silwood1]CAF4828972.1 unnamed protein product [Rotaria sp. Silwood1]CAF4900256.1 unnamed protein product [Rotaria sp. Silwood1]
MLNNTTTDTQSLESLIVAYYSLILVIIGTLFNCLTFFVLCRSTFRDKKARPIIHYMRTIAIFDILMLYGWNLDHYLVIVHEFRLVKYSIVSCKCISFISYFTSQTSAWLRVFVCFDRYLSLSHFHRPWMNRSKTVLIIIACVIMTSILLNLHILIFACYRKNNGTISIQAQSYKIYPLWNHVNLGVYNCAPFILMVILNSGVSYHLFRFHHTNSTPNSRIQHRAITLTLVITTSLFLLMTIPATVAYAYFMQANVTILHFLDAILYTYHVLSFPLYLITFNEFRRACIEMLTCKFGRRKVAPLIHPPQ